MSRYRTPAIHLLLGAALVGAAGCLGPGGVLGDDQGNGGPDSFLIGGITATTLTTGPAPDPDGYRVSLDEARTENIDINGAVEFYPVPAGTYGVLLSGLDGTCDVTGANPQYVTVKPDSFVVSHFDVFCP